MKPESSRREEAEIERLVDQGLMSYHMARLAVGSSDAGRLMPTEESAPRQKKRGVSRRGGRSYPEVSGRDVSRMIANKEANDDRLKD